MFVAVIVAMYVVGALFERITLSTVRGRRYSKNAEADLVPMVVATIGLGYLLKGAVRVVPYTEEVRRLPPLLAGPPVFIGDVILQQQDLAIIVVTIVVMAGAHACSSAGRGPARPCAPPARTRAPRRSSAFR